MDEVTRGDYMHARIEQEVPEVSPRASHREMLTLRNVVAFRNHLAKADPIENTTPKTPKALKRAVKVPTLPRHWILRSSQK